jgi:hypothetical protein
VLAQKHHFILASFLFVGKMVNTKIMRSWHKLILFYGVRKNIDFFIKIFASHEIKHPIFIYFKWLNHDLNFGRKIFTLKLIEFQILILSFRWRNCWRFFEIFFSILQILDFWIYFGIFCNWRFREVVWVSVCVSSTNFFWLNVIWAW